MLTPDSPCSPTTPEEYLARGITHHERDELPTSAACFERAATRGGGCPVGMLMWGLSLRHGWGVTRDERRAFSWLMRAAEHATGDLESARKGGKPSDDVKVGSTII